MENNNSNNNQHSQEDNSLKENQDSPLAQNLKVPEEEENKRMEIHTLKDDLEKFKQTGGEVDFSESLNSPSQPEEKISPDEPPAFSPPPFSPDKVQEISKEGSIPSNQAVTGGDMRNNDSKAKKLLVVEIIGGALAVSLLIGIFSYFFYFKKGSSSNNVQKTPTPIASNQTSTPSQAQTPTSTPNKTPATFIHSSFFSNIDISANIDVPILSPVILKNKLSEQASTINNSSGTKTILKEIVITKNSVPVPFSDFFETIIPEISRITSKNNLKLSDLFKDDFSLEIASLNSGPQLIYVAKIKDGKDTDVKEIIEGLIEIPGLAKNLAKTHFFSDPGQPLADSFKKGSLDGTQTYYIPYTNNHLAFNFGFKNNYFIVFTSKKVYDNFIVKFLK